MFKRLLISNYKPICIHFNAKYMNFKLLAGVALIALTITSCSTKRSPLPYFEDITTTTQINVPTDTYSQVVEPDDELYIMVTSYSPAATAQYNLPMTNPASREELTKTTTPQQQTYLVDANGDINMPILGTLHVAGKTTAQVRDMILQLVSKDVDDATVVVKLVNFKVEVAGEVKNPGVQVVERERYSILDALTAAGDLTEYGERNNILLVREENGKRTAYRLNLNSSDLLSSPNFYLKQNDYVYVEPNKIREDNSKYNTNNSFKVSVISTVVSACSVVASLVIALTVK